MANAMVILLVANLLLLSFLLWRALTLSRLAQVLESELQILRNVPHDEALDLDEVLGRGSRKVVVLDILNPMEVAASQSWFADKFGSVAAPLIRKIVYDQAVKNVYTETAKWGVQAQVVLHRAS